ncbi:DUF3883 domain-containing protein [Porcincola intestinalis]|uniref:DUF3883 domain-containing protein n=1 Tax=Porcincola intestinalis TaxID=2606632 RepID=A0A6L5X3C9_9FIRM|nr:DUF3883 domain-containing protein [Porcincola intestinalis]MSS13466.1 DUF3883 domain-containing protein [Porcincola intestinalis]
MRRFKDVVKEVSDKFINEAKQSPQLISDMAKMEYYMAESYCGRLFIELLQNADDAKATRIISFYNNGNLYFGNNGKPFDEEDLVAISRSGASEKQRGKTIGYRGIGFKSASAVSKEIIIHSANTYFSFSKEKCAKLLNMNSEDVPTIRIPIYLENVEQKIQDDVEVLKDSGYSTIFVFTNVDVDIYLEELRDVNDGFFLFLNNVYECVFDICDFKDQYSIGRFSNFGNEHVEIQNALDTTEWMIVKNRDAAVAFLIKDGIIVPCKEEQAVYHCYLPTLEKSIVLCKINADFSTDPSRKHITLDDKTKDSLKRISQIIGLVFEKALNEADTGKYKNIFRLFQQKSTTSKINFYLDGLIETDITSRKWIKLENGEKISPNEYKLLPASFDLDNPSSVRVVNGEISKDSLPKQVYENIDEIEPFMSRYSTKRLSIDVISKDLSDKNYVKQLNLETYTQLLIGTIRESKMETAINAEYSPKLDSFIIKNDRGEYTSIEDLVEKEEEIEPSLRREIKDRLGDSEIKWFQAQVETKNLISETPQDEEVATFNSSRQGKEEGALSPHIAKWRNAESKCVSIEESMGNEAYDVSLKNYGYDVESTTPDGEHRYIEVKSVKKDFGFSLTNNEYAAAYQYGAQYFVCLLLEDDDKLIARYIQDPLKNARFEKRIKQWEWICLDCNSVTLSFDLDS